MHDNLGGALLGTLVHRPHCFTRCTTSWIICCLVDAGRALTTPIASRFGSAPCAQFVYLLANWDAMHIATSTISTLSPLDSSKLPPLGSLNAWKHQTHKPTRQTPTGWASGLNRQQHTTASPGQQQTDSPGQSHNLTCINNATHNRRYSEARKPPVSSLSSQRVSYLRFFDQQSSAL